MKRVEGETAVSSVSRRDFLKGMALFAISPWLDGVHLGNENRQATEDLPEDIVSEETLKGIYKTTIHQLPQIQLYLRQKILEEEPVFPWLKAGKERTLTIMLVDGPTIGTPYFSQNQKEVLGEEIWERLQQIEIHKGKEYLEDTAVKKYFLSVHKEELDKLNKQLTQNQLDKNQYDSLKARLDDYFRFFLEEPTPEDIAAVGAHTYVGLTYFNRNDGIYIFLAVGRKKSLPNQKPEFYYNNLQDFTPRPYQSFPHPDKLKKTNNPNVGLVRADTAGFVSRHEFSHIMVDEDGDVKAENSEVEVDKKVIESLRRASDALVEGDNSLYYFVFRGPAGIVITRNLKSLQKHRSMV